jgi:hypothetical protein
MKGRPIRCLLIAALGGEDATLSYYRGYIDALPRHPEFDCAVLDLGRSSFVDRARQLLRAATMRCDVVVLLHSVYSNVNRMPEPIAECLSRRNIPMVVFAANEYKLMPDKVRFYRRIGVDLLLTQLPDPSAHRLYRDALNCAVAEFPHSGLWEHDLYPEDTVSRDIDIGYRAYEQPFYLGHVDRTRIMDLVGPAARAAGLNVDISTDPNARFGPTEWRVYLRRCRAQLGVESGTDYFELDDSIRLRTNAYMREHPETDFATAFDMFFKHYSNRVSGRAISGRIVEAAAARCVQLLLEGDYSGYFDPDVHYIPVARDGRNVAEAIERLADRDYCNRIARAAMDRAWEQFSYTHLGERLAGLFRATF